MEDHTVAAAAGGTLNGAPSSSTAANATASSSTALGKRARSPATTEQGNGTHKGPRNGQTSDASESSDDDDDVGPMPMPAGGSGGPEGDGQAAAGKASSTSKAAAKKRKLLKYEKVYLDNMPNADRYYSELNSTLLCSANVVAVTSERWSCQPF